MYGFENMLFEKPVNRPGIGDWWTFLVLTWFSLGSLGLEKSYSFNERDVTTGTFNWKKSIIVIINNY